MAQPVSIILSHLFLFRVKYRLWQQWVSEIIFCLRSHNVTPTHTYIDYGVGASCVLLVKTRNANRQRNEPYKVPLLNGLFRCPQWWWQAVRSGTTQSTAALRSSTSTTIQHVISIFQVARVNILGEKIGFQFQTIDSWILTLLDILS